MTVRVNKIKCYLVADKDIMVGDVLKVISTGFSTERKKQVYVVESGNPLWPAPIALYEDEVTVKYK